MNIDGKFFGAILFLVAQTSGAIWWASSLSAEVERVANVQAASMAETSGLDVLGFKVDELRKEIASLREVDREIMMQHEKIFEWMAAQNSSRSSSPYPSYD
jgi:hypothetical protein